MRLGNIPALIGLDLRLIHDNELSVLEDSELIIREALLEDLYLLHERALLLLRLFLLGSTEVDHDKSVSMVPELHVLRSLAKLPRRIIKLFLEALLNFL